MRTSFGNWRYIAIALIDRCISTMAKHGANLASHTDLLTRISLRTNRELLLSL